MPERDHLHRLSNVWITNPLYFVTICSADRRKFLTTPDNASVLKAAWLASPSVSGWVIGRYVTMPDHVHFFARPQPDGKTLSAFIRDWKRWTARGLGAIAEINSPVWQTEFFDHVLRSADSYLEKWEYVRTNPVRAGHTPDAQAWPYAGEFERLTF